jgi:hypothetical protein
MRLPSNSMPLPGWQLTRQRELRSQLRSLDMNMQLTRGRCQLLGRQQQHVLVVQTVLQRIRTLQQVCL